MKGCRTLIVAAVIAACGVLDASTSVLHQLLGDRVGAWVALGSALLMAVLRVVTTGPVLTGGSPPDKGPADGGGAS